MPCSARTWSSSPPARAAAPAPAPHRSSRTGARAGCPDRRRRDPAVRLRGLAPLAPAEAGIEALTEAVDTLIIIPNDKLLEVWRRDVDARRLPRADEVLRKAIHGISSLITLTGLVNLDFADVRTIIADAGNALLGIGMGQGREAAVDAAAQATSSPLLETTLEGARSVLSRSPAAATSRCGRSTRPPAQVQETARQDTNIIFGAMVDEKLEDEVSLAVVATGYEGPAPGRAASSCASRRASRG